MQVLDNEFLPESGRSETRTNMLVIASVSALTASGPIRIRNLSRHGALIEGGHLPGLGEHLKLRRGALAASGRIVRLLGNKAGVRFDGPIDVSQWLPSEHCAQQRVDEAFHSIRAGATHAMPLEGAPALAHSPADAAQLRELALALNALADELAENSAVVMRHGSKLQTLDIASDVEAIGRRRVESPKLPSQPFDPV
jgi:hypothetical protein